MPFGIIRFCNSEQPEKADCPISVTLSEILIIESEEQSLNASPPIDVTPLGMIILMEYISPE